MSHPEPRTEQGPEAADDRRQPEDSSVAAPDAPGAATSRGGASPEGDSDTEGSGSVETAAEPKEDRSRPSAERESEPLGPIGQPLKRHSPFYVGFFGAAGALLAIWLGQQIISISSVLILIVVAMFLAVGLNPMVEFFMRRGLKRSWSLLVVIAIVLTTVGLFILAIVPVISDQVSALVDRAPDWFDQLRTNDRIQQLDERYDLINRAQQAIEDGNLAQRAFGGAVGVGLALVGAILNTFIIIVLTMYFLASLPTIKHTAYRLAPASRRERVTSLGDRILSNVGGYVSGAFLVALAAGISSLVFLFIVGLGEYAVALAVVVAVLDVIPMIGATLGAVIVTAIGFATDPKIGLACLIFYIVYQQFENYVVYPRVMSRSVDIPGSLIVIAALVGAALLGVVGALLAIPTAAALQLLLKEVFLRRQDVR